MKKIKINDPKSSLPLLGAKMKPHLSTRSWEHGGYIELQTVTAAQMRESTLMRTSLLQRGADSQLGEVGRGGVFTEATAELACKDRRSLGGGERGEGKHSSLPAQHVCSHGGVKGHRVFQNGQDWVWSEGRTWGWSGRGGSRASTVSDVPLPARPPASGSGRGSAMLVTRCRWGWGWPGVRRAD